MMSTRHARWAAAATAVAAAIAGALAALLLTAPVWAAAPAAAAPTTAAPLAIVTQDQVALRAAPRDAAAQQAVLWQGDVLEVRGERLGYLQVYDHRRERAGYVLASQVRGTALAPEEAPALLAVLRFVRDTPGAEALGIAYAAAYLKAAPADAITAEPFDALASLAERLAQRASVRQANGRTGDALAAHLEVARSYGVQFASFEVEGAMRLCYDGDAYRRVFALPASAEQRARAALALTRHDCMAPDLRPLARTQLDSWRAEVLDCLDSAQWQQLAAPLKNRLRLRRAGVWSAIAFERSRQGDALGAATAAQRAIGELAAIDKNELADGDGNAYPDAALRVGAVRWAALPAAATAGATTDNRRAVARAKPTIITAPGQPGETCALLVDATHDVDGPLAKRCSYGVIWAASASTRADGRAVALAVQPLAGWRELWMFRRDGVSNVWSVAVLPPAASNPELGYVEFAGWVPGSDKLLLAREARVEGRYQRSFEVANLATLNTVKQARAPAQLALFDKWQDPAWKRSTVILR